MFKLALALGTTVEELGERMDYDEFVEWQEYFSLEPWGTQADDYRWETYMRMFWSVNATKGSIIPRFIDWDPDETARLQREKEQREAGMTLDEKLRSYFGGKSAAIK